MLNDLRCDFVVDELALDAHAQQIAERVILLEHAARARVGHLWVFGVGEPGDEKGRDDTRRTIRKLA